MITEDVTQKVIRWDRDDAGLFYGAIHETIDYRARRHFNGYMPTLQDSPFPIRLREWLANCASEEQQKILFRLLPHLFYVSAEEFVALYTAAYRGPILKWLMEIDSIPPLDPKVLDKIQGAEDATWFCPITDSMQIASFYHVNNISGRDLRPDWRSLVTLGVKIPRLIEYMSLHSLKRVVLLEDFVGSGSQCKSTLQFITAFDSSINFLFVPLIICSKGLKACNDIIASHSNIEMAPIITLGEGVLLNGEHTPSPPPNDPSLFKDAQSILKELLPLVRGSGATPKNAFGFNGMGPLLIMFSNCPNNTPPVFHYKSTKTKWKPLFKRSSRL